MVEHCSTNFKFDRGFMAWIRNGVPKTLGEAVNDWLLRDRAPPERPMGIRPNTLDVQMGVHVYGRIRIGDRPRFELTCYQPVS